ncbi:MAG: MogA/MoaB family molybdenum cofactor biosynthesis protein [Firmicutes bacterium]|nr:MogA/MoaB family molybdenum cofactor biosynthesis protein [Bacillota bacterium]
MTSFTVAVLTASDKGARGEREDESGRVIHEMVASIGGQVIAYDVVPDDYEVLTHKLTEYADVDKANLILTTGGTGLSSRDNTPEATLAVIEKQVPGMAEAMRAFGLEKTPHAMLSRAVCGIRRHSLIVNLPGSPRAVRENLSVILPAIPHALQVLCDEAADCATLRKDDV